MGTIVSSKLTPAEVLEILEMTPSDVVKETGLGINAVRRATMGGNRRTNIKTARIIAEFFGLTVDDLSWPAGLTHVGRTPLTGGTYTIGGTAHSLGHDEGYVSGISRDDQAPRSTKKPTFESKFCDNPEHNLELPLTGVCDLCVA